MERKLAEPGLVDGMASDLGGPRTAAIFARCDEYIPWKRLAASLQGLYGEHDKGGREPWPMVLMIKCLMLQKWFGLSDPQLEEQLRDRLSFRRFVGLSLMDGAPDETTFVRFRKRLLSCGQGRTLFDEVVKHLESCGLVMKNGTLVDATIVEAPAGASVRRAPARATRRLRSRRNTGAAIMATRHMSRRTRRESSRITVSRRPACTIRRRWTS